MKRRMMFLALMVLLLLVSGCSMHGDMGVGAEPCCDTMTQTTAMDQAGSQDTRSDVLYACACGDGCNCNSVSAQPGNCRCGKPMEWNHVVKVEGDEALLCSCSEGCTCKQDAADPSKCACGKPLKRVSLAGTGMFFCNCGGSCTCNTISGEAGACKCGMPLKQM
jgi:hypothetical protein